MAVRLQAPAKINWLLAVIGKREDGYHAIESIIQCIDLFDQLSFDLADTVSIETDLDVPTEENLVYKAAILLKKHARYRGGCRIGLRKHVPLVAGLGGGSSDAAHTLLGLNELWGLGLSREVLLELSARIGSDVPFFIQGGTSFIEGRGEKVTVMEAGGAHALLLVKPPIDVPASFAYARCRIGLTKKLNDIKLFSRALASRDYRSLREMAFNDLEPQIISEYPVIGEIKRMLTAEGSVLSLMSGSGPTVFGVFDTFDQAERASGRMGDFWCRAVRTLD